MFGSLCDALNLLQVFMGSFYIEQREWENGQLLISLACNHVQPETEKRGYGSIEVFDVMWPVRG